MLKTAILLSVATCAVTFLAISKFGSPFAGESRNAGEPRNGWERKAALETLSQMNRLSSAANTIANWPPVIGNSFPRFELFDHTGKPFLMTDLAGKPTIIEFISMSCAGCQAFAGGNQVGPYGGLASQGDMKTFERYYRDYTGLDLHSGDVNFVVAVVYNDKLQSPTQEDLSAWRTHFQMESDRNTYVVSSPKLASAATFKMIPGFMLLDQNHVVRYDSTGHQPKHNLYTELLPAVPKMIRSR